MAAEAKIQEKILVWLRKQGHWVVKYPAGVHGTTGTPDILACVMGMFVALEVKAPGGKQTKMQAHQQAEIVKSGGICEVVSSVEDVAEVIKRIRGHESI